MGRRDKLLYWVAWAALVLLIILHLSAVVSRDTVEAPFLIEEYDDEVSGEEKVSWWHEMNHCIHGSWHGARGVEPQRDAGPAAGGQWFAMRIVELDDARVSCGRRSAMACARWSSLMRTCEVFVPRSFNAHRDPEKVQ